MGFTTIAEAVDFTDVLAAGSSVAAAVIGVYVAIKGYQLLKSFLTK